ncbi:MAG: glycosyltransferase family 2 protein [Deltaproteobacteria bacterium]|nr:glycosyltransferase family 2 protein [Deltaproteobacteria bacterium]
MKLIIQIPCLNEEQTLPAVLQDLPKKIDGIDVIETMVIDDGSSDRTVETAKRLGVTHIISLKRNQGLARAFSTGIHECLKRGADIIVNTDGDNQYQGACIKDLVQPVVAGKLDVVVGARPIMKIDEFSFVKKILQKIGSWVVRMVSNTTIPDATSGFRAYSKEAALQLVVTDRFTYTLDTLIQAGNSAYLHVGHVNIDTNPKTRESRLFHGIYHYITKSMRTIVQMFVYYKPFTFFLWISCLFFVFELAIGVRFILNIYLFHIPDRTYVPSLILMSIFAVFGVGALLAGILGSLFSKTRVLAMENIYLNRKILLEKNSRQ